VKAKYARFFTAVLWIMVLIVPLYVFIADIAGLPGGSWRAAVLVALVAYALRMIPKRKTLPAIENQGTMKTRPRWLPDWFLFGFLILIGLIFNWACAFLWFSRRCAFFSVPVLAVMGFIVAFYASIGSLVARLIGRDWRTAVGIFALTSYAVSGNLAWWLDLHR